MNNGLPYILAHVFVDRIAWVMVADGETIGHGEVATLEQVQLQQTVAGLLNVFVAATVRIPEVAQAIKGYQRWDWASPFQALEISRRIEQARKAEEAATT